MPIIREYRPEDLRHVEACFVELQDFLHGLGPQVREGRAATQYFDAMFARCADTHEKIFVAEAEQQVVGFICLWARVQSEELDEEPSEYAYISDLVILPAYRGRGLGRALLEKAEEHARLHGATTLKIESLAKNEVATTLYKKSGFAAYQALLVKRLQTSG